MRDRPAGGLVGRVTGLLVAECQDDSRAGGEGGRVAERGVQGQGPAVGGLLLEFQGEFGGPGAVLGGEDGPAAFRGPGPLFGQGGGDPLLVGEPGGEALGRRGDVGDAQAVELGDDGAVRGGQLGRGRAAQIVCWWSRTRALRTWAVGP